VVDEKTPEEVSLKIIESQKTLKRLSRIIRALLMISKIENEQYIRNEACCLREMTGEVLDEVEERLEQKHIEVKNDVDEYEFKPCNKSLVHTMIFNLVNNAIKYNKDHGRITLTGRQKDGEYEFEIADTGIGIDKEHLEAVFERFKKIQGGDENSFGLGLPIVKTIAQFHRIQISVKSVVGEGTAFTLRFPAA
jgi:signal transduction histidine kinase